MIEIENTDGSKFPHRGTGGLIPHIEALIFASDKPLAPFEITELINNAFGFMEDKIEAEQIDAALEGIVEKYNSEFYPFEVRQSGGGWQFLTKKEFHKTVAQINGDKFLKRLSAATLETLAIIAYKQPITKGEIESIRGVNSDYSVQKLLEKELVIISGRNEKMPGHPLIYATSKNFMDYFGINSADDLPKIKEVLTEQMIEPTAMQNADTESGELLITNEEQLIIPGEETAELHLNGHEFSGEEPGFEKEPEGEELSETDFMVDADTDAAINEDGEEETELNNDESVIEDENSDEDDGENSNNDIPNSQR